MILRIFSLVLLVLGLSIFALGGYISYQAELGEEQMSAAEERVEDQQRPMLGPIRKKAHAESTETAQQKIGAEKEKIALSQLNASWLYGAGIILFIAGITSFLLRGRFY